MKKILLLILASFLFLNAANKVEKTTEKNVEQTTKEDTSLAESDIEIENMVEANILNEKISKIELSLKDNILLGKTENPEDINIALKKSGFSQRLKTLDNGLDTLYSKEFDKNGVEIIISKPFLVVI